MRPWRPVRSSVMSDLKPYLLSRMEEMRQIDPRYWGELRESFITEFGKPESTADALADEQRQDWWLHNFAQYRIDRLMRREVNANKKTGREARR